MKVTFAPSELVAFEEDIANCFAEKKILAPIHLYDGNEEQMIYIFEKFVKEEDWVLCSWRSHYQCLLKGVPPEEVKQKIIEGKSISLCFPKYKILSSAIVGGVLPIAVGLAMAIKHGRKKGKVVVFMGDMTSETGIAHECIKYCNNWKLPVFFVVEDNDKSVCTPTRYVWNSEVLTYEHPTNNVMYYQYKSKYPHAGGHSRVQF